MPGAGQQEEVERALARWGRDATCHQALKSWCRVFQVAHIPGQICYNETPTAWIAVGTPLTADQEVGRLAAEFAAQGKERRLTTAFFGVEPRGKSLLQNFSALRMGLQPILELPRWLEQESERGEVGRQYRRGRRKGVEVRTVEDSELRLDHQMENLSRAWIRRRNLATMGFMTDPNLNSGDRQATFFQAWCEERLVGLLRVIPSPQGFLLENVMVGEGAPNGTAEVLIVEAARWADSQGAAEITLGLAPLCHYDAEEEIATAESEDGPWWLRRFLGFCYRRLGFLYNFRGLTRFKKKFRPTYWQSVYLIHNNGPLHRYRALFELLRTFAGGSLLDFLRRTTVMKLPLEGRFWRAGCVFFTLTLLPWLTLLYLAPGETWFGCDWLGRAWALFDVVVAGLFLRLGWGLRFRASWLEPFAYFTLGFVSADVCLTWLQFFLFNLPRGPSWWEWPVLLAALAAPLLALTYLRLLILCLRPPR